MRVQHSNASLLELLVDAQADLPRTRRDPRPNGRVAEASTAHNRKTEPVAGPQNRGKNEANV